MKDSGGNKRRTVNDDDFYVDDVKSSSSSRASGSSKNTGGSKTKPKTSSASSQGQKKELSGVQKYSRKMHLKESSSNKTSSKKTPTRSTTSGSGSGVTRNTSSNAAGTRSSGNATNKNAKLATEKYRTGRDRRKGRFSTHGRAALIFVFIILFIGVTVFAAMLSYTYLVDRYENPVYADEIDLDEETTVKFHIDKGSTTKDITAKLKENGLIKNEFLFKLLSKFNGYDGEYKSGTHYLSGGLTYDEIMVLLCADPETVNVTFPEGFTTVQIAERLEANRVCGKEEFLRALNNIDVSSYPFAPSDAGGRDYFLDGYLFPDTYKFETDSTPDTVIYKLLNRFNEIFIPEYYARTEKLGLTVDQLVIIASFVEKEAKVASDRPIIASVYYNRLFSEDLKLMQCESTILYIKRRTSTDQILRVTAEDLKTDDPYNTYLYEGLTPGPICSPSEDSIKAVIQMNPTDYYYYVLKNDGSGTHIFSRTYEEHQKAVEEQRAGTNNG
ncbi:MAG: endolytic transglycosylase MltG [Clostridia bacterium]|nr:endolytic transglycosylase MltG [Clostridia bacterium]